MPKIKNCLKSLKNFSKGKIELDKQVNSTQQVNEKIDTKGTESVNLMNSANKKSTDSIDSVDIGLVFDKIDSILEPAAPANSSVLGVAQNFDEINEISE